MSVKDKNILADATGNKADPRTIGAVCQPQITYAYLAEHVLLMPVPLVQSGHAKEMSPGRSSQVQGNCIRVRWQVRGTAAVPPHGGGSWRGGLKIMGLLHTDFPPYVYSDCCSYFTLRAWNWICKGLEELCYHFRFKNGSSKPLLCCDLTL